MNKKEKNIVKKRKKFAFLCFLAEIASPALL